MIISIPHRAILQQQTRLMSNHQLWKRHVLLGCSVQSQQAKQLTAQGARHFSYHVEFKFSPI